MDTITIEAIILCLSAVGVVLIAGGIITIRAYRSGRADEMDFWKRIE